VVPCDLKSLGGYSLGLYSHRLSVTVLSEHSTKSLPPATRCVCVCVCVCVRVGVSVCMCVCACVHVCMCVCGHSTKETTWKCELHCAQSVEWGGWVVVVVWVGGGGGGEYARDRQVLCSVTARKGEGGNLIEQQHDSVTSTIKGRVNFLDEDFLLVRTICFLSYPDCCDHRPSHSLHHVLDNRALPDPRWTQHKGWW
jgi:hypothetical protein